MNFDTNHTSYDDVVKFYRKFLDGYIDWCPTHRGHLKEESYAIQSQLLQINKFGIISVDSQPGMGHPVDGDGSKYKQRAYLECYMKKDIMQKLKKNLYPDLSMLEFKCNIDDKYKNTKEKYDYESYMQNRIPLAVKCKNGDEILMYSSYSKFHEAPGWAALSIINIVSDYKRDKSIDCFSKSYVRSREITKSTIDFFDDLYLVFIMDTTYNRETYLFDSIVKILTK